MTKIKLTTLSETLNSQGNVGIVVDHSYQKNEHGVPFIPGKTIKGLISESADTLNELHHNTYSSIKEKLFGKVGGLEGTLHIPNLQLVDGNMLLNDILLAWPTDENYTEANLETYLSIVRHQTRVDTDGIAAQGSLRTYNVLKKDLIFEANIDEILTDREVVFFYLSCLLTDQMGIRRNRGWGSVKIEITEHPLIENKSIDELFHLLKTPSPLEGANVNSIDHSTEPIEDDTHTKLTININTLSPLIISNITKSSFNVSTKKYIPGKTIRGLLAWRYINAMQTYDSSYNPSHDGRFKSLFLNSNIIFKNAYPSFKGNNFFPAPNFIVKKKYEKDDLFHHTQSTDIQDVKTKSINELMHVISHKSDLIDPSENLLVDTLNIKTTNQFHHHRDDRQAGRNTNGAIFYYESINEGVQFQCQIEAPQTQTDIFRRLIEVNTIARIGRSRSSQYGKVALTIEPKKEHNTINTETLPTEAKYYEFMFYLISPMILYNDLGIPEVSHESFETYFNFQSLEGWELGSIKRSKERIFRPQWRTYQDMQDCFSIGSSWSCSTTSQMSIKELYDLIGPCIGEHKDIGFGQYIILPKSRSFEGTQKNNKLHHSNPNTISKETIKASTFYNHVIDEKKKTEIRICAFKNARLYKNSTGHISNSLFSRLIDKLKAPRKPNSVFTYIWKSFMEEILFKDSFRVKPGYTFSKIKKELTPKSAKMAGIQLLKSGDFFKNLYEFNYPNELSKSLLDEPMKLSYWLQVLEIMRKENSNTNN